MGSENLRATIYDTPFEDHHVHAPENRGWIRTNHEFRRVFTESSLESVWRHQSGDLLSYRWMVRELASLLDVEADEDVVVEARNHMDPIAYQRLLADQSNLGACYADHLFASDISYSIEEWSEVLGGRPVYPVLRIETFIEQQCDECATLDEALDRMIDQIRRSRELGIVSLKSISGYRTGLKILGPSASQRRLARLAYHRFRETRLSGKPARIETKELVDTIVWTALDAAAELGLPCQFHVGLGDDDIVMTQNDPTLMREVLQHEKLRNAPIVLLHCYPYHRQAAYLANLYPNVYVDLGLTIPLAGAGSDRVLEETLELVPVNRLLASTDGHGAPEFQWFGIFVWRWALDRVFQKYVEMHIVDESYAILAVQAILRDNARAFYPLPVD